MIISVITVSSWQIEFTQPLWFLLLAALPLLGIFWRWSLVHASLGRKIVLFLLRSLLLLLVAAGLAGPRAKVPERQQVAGVKWAPSGKIALPAVELTAPEQVRAGESFSVKAVLRSKTRGEAALELLRDGKPVPKGTATLAAGENRKVFSVVAPEPSQVVYSLRVRDEHGVWPADDQIPCAVYVDPPPRVLLVESESPVESESAPAEHFLQKALAGDTIAVDVKAELPDGNLAAYDLIILSNVPALPKKAQTSVQDDDRIQQKLRDKELAWMKALRTYVGNDRGGLIVIGGDQSFTAGNYRGTVLEEILPVISEPRKDKPKPTLAMVLVLDISGSMNDPLANKKLRNIDLAKQALETAVNMLEPGDQVGVLVFEDRSHWIWPLAPVGNKANKDKIIAKIKDIKAEGSTTMYPPLDQAYLALREAFADLKHIIVTTDGLGEPGDFDGLAQKIDAQGITITTVGVGNEPAQPFLQSIADRAKGRAAKGQAHFCRDAESVPQIFQRDTRMVTQRGITEEVFVPEVRRRTPVLRGLDKAPPLSGYAETVAKPESQVVLESKTGQPILAMWRYGGGTVAAFTSDIHHQWAGPWLDDEKWPGGFGKFWVQLVRQTMRRNVPKTSRLTTAAGGGRLFFTLDAADRDGFINGADVSVTESPHLHDPLRGYPGEGRGEGSKSHAPVHLTQVAPGRYAGLQAAGQGTYWLDGQVRRNGQLVDSVRSGVVAMPTPEVAVKVDGTIETAEKTVSRIVLLWPWLLGDGLVLLVIDLAVRRTGKPPR